MQSGGNANDAGNASGDGGGEGDNLASKERKDATFIRLTQRFSNFLGKISRAASPTNSTTSSPAISRKSSEQMRGLSADELMAMLTTPPAGPTTSPKTTASTADTPSSSDTSQKKLIFNPENEPPPRQVVAAQLRRTDTPRTLSRNLSTVGQLISKPLPPSTLPPHPASADDDDDDDFGPLVFTCGSTTHGKLGYEVQEFCQSTPRPVRPLSGLIRIARVACGPQLTAAIDENGTLYVWGAGYGKDDVPLLGVPTEDGSVGIANPQPRVVHIPKPPGVTCMPRVERVAIGKDHMAAIAVVDVDRVWGGVDTANDQAVFDDTPMSPMKTHTGHVRHSSAPATAQYSPNSPRLWPNGPLSAAAGSPPTGRVVSTRSTASRRSLYTWGWGARGQLGHGDDNSQLLPTRVAAFDVSTGDNQGEPVDVAAGEHHTVVLLSTGDIYTFGDNTAGQLGLGSNAAASVSTPTRVGFGSELTVTAIAIAAGPKHTAAVVSVGGCHDNRRVYVWGDAVPLGLGPPGAAAAVQNEPLHVAALDSAVVGYVSCGQFYTAALTSLGDVYMWGLPPVDTATRVPEGPAASAAAAASVYVSTPTRMAGLCDYSVRMVACGSKHMAAVTDSGDVITFGRDTFGQLGAGGDSAAAGGTAVDTTTEKAALPLVTIMKTHEEERNRERVDPSTSTVAASQTRRLFCTSVACGDGHTAMVAMETPSNPTPPFLRERQVWRLLETERSYVRTLDILVEVYLGPLRTKLPAGATLPGNAGAIPRLISLLGSAETLRNIHRRVLSRLDDRMRVWSPAASLLADVFLDPEFAGKMTLYIEYCRNYLATLSAIDSLRVKQPKPAATADAAAGVAGVDIEQFLAECEVATETRRKQFSEDRKKDHSLKALLSEIAQRPHRYLAALRNIASHTSNEHPDYGSLVSTCRQLEGVTRELLYLHNLSEFRRIAATIIGMDTAMQPYRQYIDKLGVLLISVSLTRDGRELKSDISPLLADAPVAGSAAAPATPATGDQWAKTDPNFRWLFLFTDALIVASATGVRCELPLKLAWVSGVDMASEAAACQFRLTTPERVFVFAATSPRERAAFVDTVSTAIHNELRRHATIISDGHRSVSMYTFSEIADVGAPAGAEKLKNAMYSGDWLDGRFHGNGTIIYPSGSKYDGDWLHGKRHGNGTQSLANGETYTGQWRDDKRHGEGTVLYGVSTTATTPTAALSSPSSSVAVSDNGPNEPMPSPSNTAAADVDHGDTLRPVMYRGEWADDRRHGRGELHLSNGDVIVSENWRDAAPVAMAAVYYSDGGRYVGGVAPATGHALRRHGYGVMAWPNGDRYYGSWKDGLPNGQNSFFAAADAFEYFGEFSRGKIHGKGALTFPTEDVLMARFSGASLNLNGLAVTDGSLLRGGGHNGYGGVMTGGAAVWAPLSPFFAEAAANTANTANNNANNNANNTQTTPVHVLEFHGFNFSLKSFSRARRSTMRGERWDTLYALRLPATSTSTPPGRAKPAPAATPAFSESARLVEEILVKSSAHFPADMTANIAAVLTCDEHPIGAVVKEFLEIYCAMFRPTPPAPAGGAVMTHMRASGSAGMPVVALSIARHTLSAALEDLHAFIASSTKHLMRHFPMLSSEEGAERCQEALVSVLLPKVVEEIFYWLKKDCEEEDNELTAKVSRLASLPPVRLHELLGVDAGVLAKVKEEEKCKEPMFSAAVQQLQQMSLLFSLDEKLQCLKLVSDRIEEQFSDSLYVFCCAFYYNHTDWTKSGADEFLPVFCYVLVHAQLPCLHAQCRFLEEFMTKSQRTNVYGYLFTQLAIAKDFIADLEEPGVKSKRKKRSTSTVRW